MEENKKKQIKTLAIHYSKTENRSKFISLCKKKTKEHEKWISNLERKVPKKLLNEIKSKADQKYKEDSKEWSIIGLLKDAASWTKEALFPSWERTKGHVAERFLSRYIVYYMVGIVGAVNYIMGSKLELWFGSNVGSLLTGIIVAPIVEELYKYLTIKMEEKEWGWFIFNLKEFFGYVIQHGGVSFKNIPFMIMRFVCTLSHVLYTKVWADKDLPKGLGSLFHAFDNGPMIWITNIVSLLGASYFGIWGYWLASIGTLLLGIKFMLNVVMGLKHPNREDSFEGEPIPQPA